MPTDREPPRADEPADDAELSSRSDARRANREIENALARLAKDLVALNERVLGKLGLPENLLDAVNDARAITSPKARERQLRLVRSALRDENWAQIRRSVDALLKHGRLPESAPLGTPALAPAWVARLLGEGAEGIEALVRAVPNADRTHLRNLVRLVKAASAERRKKAEERLMAAVESLLR